MISRLIRGKFRLFAAQDEQADAYRHAVISYTMPHVRCVGRHYMTGGLSFVVTQCLDVLKAEALAIEYVQQSGTLAPGETVLPHSAVFDGRSTVNLELKIR